MFSPGYYKVLFSDGFKKKLKASNIRYVNVSEVWLSNCYTNNYEY